MNTEGLVILLIDMQKGFVVNLRDGEKERIIPNQIKVLEHFIRRNVPIIVFEGWPEKYSHTVDELLSVVRKSNNFEIMKKTSNNAFYNGELKERLEALNAKRLLIMGINACFCIRATASGAIHNGYDFITSNDLISGMKNHDEDNDIPWFCCNGDCLDSIEEIISC